MDRPPEPSPRRGTVDGMTEFAPHAADRVPTYADRGWVATAAALDGSPASRLAARQGFVITRRQARLCGMVDAEVRRAVRRGAWSVPRRGVLSPVPRGTADTALAATATALVHPASVVSHRSAAVLLGLPLLSTPVRPAVTVTDVGRACGRPDVRVHVATLGPSDVGSWFGAPVTSTARTVVDIARNDGLAAGLVGADGALRARLLTRDAMAAAVRRAYGWPGVTVARELVGLANALSESPLESLVRLCLVMRGIPAPELQVEIHAEDRLHRADMLWRERRVIVEADGRVKYSDDALWREKLRQERLERAGFRVVRVTWAEVTRRPDEVAWRVRRALQLGGSYGPSGP